MVRPDPRPFTPSYTADGTRRMHKYLIVAVWHLGRKIFVRAGQDVN